MTKEIFLDLFGSLRHDESAGVLELRWLEGSAGMSDDDFMDWLSRYADAEESIRAPYLLIDVTRFSFRPGEHVGEWRDQHVVPRYNAAGVRKFAFLVPEGSPGTVGAGNAAAVEPPGDFPTGYFDSRQQIIAWFSE